MLTWIALGLLAAALVSPRYGLKGKPDALGRNAFEPFEFVPTPANQIRLA
jgi:hypothetical protein